MSPEVAFALYLFDVILIAMNLMWVGVLLTLRGIVGGVKRHELTVSTLQSLAVLLVLFTILYFLHGQLGSTHVPNP